MIAREFDAEAHHGAEEQVLADDGPRAVRAAEAPVEVAEEQRVSPRLVELRGMPRDKQRNTCQRIRVGIAEGYSPRQIALLAPAAPSREEPAGTRAVPGSAR